ncbi:hypothetical protein Syun_008294 [Stephania yunnanensis]|uniref:beta-galactosidase n=1 Tax=Stephania yunnanensis TaxID=152371 RepID=A0AAP0KF00_9MAGN
MVMSITSCFQIGLEGEYLGLDKVSNANSSLWNSGVLPINQSLIWYQTKFVTPKGNGPLSLNLGSMGKGQAWVNGQSIGRYWPGYLAPSTGCTDNCDYRGSYDASKCLKNCGQPSQTLYHVPRSWVHSGENLLVLHEEIGGDPSKISIFSRTSVEICSHVSESDLPPVDAWESTMRDNTVPFSEVRLTCERGWRISSIDFASFGNAEGECGKFRQGICHAENTIEVVREVCIGRESCSIPLSNALFGDPCPGLLKSLAVEALCRM